MGSIAVLALQPCLLLFCRVSEEGMERWPSREVQTTLELSRFCHIRPCTTGRTGSIVVEGNDDMVAREQNMVLEKWFRLCCSPSVYRSSSVAVPSFRLPT